MNRQIHTVTQTTPENVKQGIKSLLHQLEKQKYVLTSNYYAVQLISRQTTREKQEGKIFFSTIKHKNIDNFKCVISLNPNYEILRINDYTFKLKRF